MLPIPIRLFAILPLVLFYEGRVSSHCELQKNCVLFGEEHGQSEPKTGFNRAQKYGKQFRRFVVYSRFVYIIMGFLGVLLIPTWLIIDS